jgi:RHS repeat-associated protein
MSLSRFTLLLSAFQRKVSWHGIIAHALLLLVLAGGGISELRAQTYGYTPTTPDNALTTADAIGIPPHTSAAGTNESVSLPSGTINVFIPALSLPQRSGWNLTLGYFHSSASYSVHQQTSVTLHTNSSGGSSIVTDTYNYTDTMFSPNPPLAINLPQLEAKREYAGDIKEFNGGGQLIAQMPVFCAMDFSFTDWSGNKHTFGNMASCNLSASNGVTRYPLMVGNYVAHMYDVTDASDGSWLRLDTSNLADLRVITKNGTVYHFSGFAQGARNYVIGASAFDVYQSYFSSMVDSNGNTVSLQATGTQINPSYNLIDEIGRTVGISGTAISYTDSNGKAQTVSFNATQQTGQQYTFNLSCSYEGSPYTAPAVDPTATPNAQHPYPPVTLNPVNIDITLPAVDSTGTSRTYHVQFDELGRITKIQYPAGGYTRYDYQAWTPNQTIGQITCTRDLWEISHKYECPSSAGNCSTSQELVTTFKPTLDSQWLFNDTVDVTDPTGAKVHHEFNNALVLAASPRETKEQKYDAAGNLLRTIQTAYTPSYYLNLELPSQITTTLNDVSPAMSAVTTYQYDTVKADPGYPTLSAGGGNSFYYIDNPTEVDEQDFAGTVKSETGNAWMTGGIYDIAGGHLLDRLQSKTVTDPATNVQSTVTYGYDGVGNITSKTVGGTGVTGLLTQYQRNSFGQITQVTDPNNNVTQFDYTDNWKDKTCAPASDSSAYLTKVTDALQHISKFQYYSCSGLKAVVQDPNDLAAANAGTVTVYDGIGRPTSISSPDGGQITYKYTDAIPNNVTETTSITSSVNKVQETLWDGFGRVSQTQLTSDPSGTDYVDTTYDALGRVASVTNPHRTTSSTTDGVTQTLYDALNRVTAVIKQDGSIIHTAYSGNVTTVTDETGRARRSVMDALGRLIEVDEPDAGSALASPGAVARAGGAVSGTEQPPIETPVSNFSFTAAPSSQNVAQGASASLSVSIAPPSGYTDTMNLSVSGLPNGATASFNPASVVGGGSSTLTITVGGGTPTGSYNLTITGDSPSYFATTTVNLAVTINPAVLMAIINNILLSDSPTLTSSAQTAQAAKANNAKVAPPAKLPMVPPMAAVPTPSVSAATTKTAASAQPNGVYLKTYDTGSVWIKVQGFTANAHYGQGSTASSVADDLASQFNAANSGSPVSAFVNGGQLNLFANVLGNNGNYRIDAQGSSSDQPGTPASFTISVPALSGGADPVAPSFTGQALTIYQYNVLGNLLCAEQHGTASGTGCSTYPNPTANDPWRPRMFTYDSLSRLLTASNPESGPISYSYDANGNVTSKTDARGITINYNPSDSPIDALNRVTKQTYSNGQTPVTYSYDQGANGIGRLTSVTDSAGSASYSYDVLGRIANEQRTIAGVTKKLSYTYNLDSSISTATYPSGATITYTPDAAGRMVSAVDSGNSINYATQATYAPDSSLTGFISGGAITNSFSYNNRLQPFTMAASTLQQKVFDLLYDFHEGNGDNGNVIGITNNRDNTRSQSFTYDTLNRLVSAQNLGIDCNQKPLNGGTKFWGNNYVYDAWGNLTQKIPTKCKSENLSTSADVQNRLHVISGADFQYDAAGNMTTNVAGPLAPQNYSYDAENRITGAGGFTYTYDADGNRVEKSNNSTGTIYWYMSPGIVAESDLTGSLTSEYVFFDGERVARKDFSGNTTSVSYYFSDHLKTASVITDAAGNVKEDEDYYPWGDELKFVDSDSNHYKFTGKERDNETQLDYFGARYYSNSLGRFITPDWAAKPAAVPYAVLDDPQSLNLYSYVRDIPTSKTDPDGHGIWDLLKRGACDIGISSACAPPPSPQQQQQNRQNLINAQDQARSKKEFQPGKVTHCSEATCFIAKQVGAPTTGDLADKKGNFINANTQAQDLAKSSDYREVTPKEAQSLADQGKLVIVAWESPNPLASGHTATVRPENVPGDNPPKGSKGPLINNVGRSVGVMGANYAFRKGMEVHYYTPK